MSNEFTDHGVEFSIPEEWTDREGHWIASDGTTISLQFHRAALDTAARLLDTYCQDLRLDAARQGGGLVECEKSQIGLTGLTNQGPMIDVAAGLDIAVDEVIVSHHTPQSIAVPAAHHHHHIAQCSSILLSFKCVAYYTR